MSAKGCAMAPMVEAARDGRLDPRERASILRHLASCAPCQALQRELDRLAALAARPVLAPQDELARQRARVRLLNIAARQDEASGKVHPSPSVFARVFARSPRLALGLVVAASLTGAFGLWRVARRGDQPAVARHLPAPVALVAQTTVVGVGDASFTRAVLGGTDRVDLDEGAVLAHVRPLTLGERFLVATSDAEVEVRGTAFRVEARARRLVGVYVTEGKVEVRRAGAAPMLLHPGESWTAATRGDIVTMGDPERVPQTPPDATHGAIGVEQAPPGSSHDAVGVPRASPGSSRSAKVQPARPVASSSSSSSAAAGSSSRAFVEGMRLVDRGDYGAAAEQLEAYRRANPSDPRAEDAAYMAAVALQRAGRREDARAAARRYLEAYPGGRRRADMDALAR